MAHNDGESLDLSDLLELMKGGAKISIDRPAQTIAQFGEFVELVKDLIATNKERISVDAERYKSQLEVLATLQALIRSSNVTRSQSTDLTQLKTVLSDFKETMAPREQLGYKLTFNRTNQGFIDGEMLITPISPSIYKH